VLRLSICCLTWPVDNSFHLLFAGSSKPETSSTNETASQSSPTKHWHWWLMVVLNIFFLIAGQTASTLLGRFYYNQGGNSKWMSTFVQTAGFPVLFIALYLFRSKSTQTATTSPETSGTKITLIYIALGLIIAADDLMYSYAYYTFLYQHIRSYVLASWPSMLSSHISSMLKSSQHWFSTL